MAAAPVAQAVCLRCHQALSLSPVSPQDLAQGPHQPKAEAGSRRSRLSRFPTETSPHLEWPRRERQYLGRADHGPARHTQHRTPAALAAPHRPTHEPKQHFPGVLKPNKAKLCWGSSSHSQVPSSGLCLALGDATNNAHHGDTATGGILYWKVTHAVHPSHAHSQPHHPQCLPTPLPIGLLILRTSKPSWDQ